MKIGKWWYKDDEIDIVALNDRKNTIFFGEFIITNTEIEIHLTVK